jgi:hypothetical protein
MQPLQGAITVVSVYPGWRYAAPRAVELGLFNRDPTGSAKGNRPPQRTRSPLGRG